MVKPIDSQDEQLYLDAVRDMITAAGAGDATAVLRKVAAARQLKPPEIQLVAQAFNQSKTAAVLKREKDPKARAATFDLANAAQVIQDLYTPSVSVEKVACELPPTDFGIAVPLQKTASDSKEKADAVTVRQAASWLHDFRLVLKQAAERLEQTTRGLSIQLMNQIRDVSPAFRHLPEGQLRKTAQLIVNGYPRTGGKFLEVLRTVSGLKIPVVEKTAFAAMFPAQEPFLAVTTIHDTAERLTQSRQAEDLLKKEASGFFQEYAANALANVTGQGVGSPLQEFAGGSSSEPVVDSSVVNRLREIDQKKAFFDLILHDRDLQQYELPELVSAYNDAAATNPDVFESPAVLKNLMLRFVETGGVRDVHQMVQEAQLSKSLLENRDKQEAHVLRRGTADREVGAASKSSSAESEPKAKNKPKPKS